MPTSETAAARAEQLAESLLPARSPKKRMLVIVNPYATTVSDRLKNLVAYALESRYAVEAVDTEKREHATQLTREAASEGYDVVVAFGGDGTVNEAANGLAGSGTPLSVLPGGATNVYCRILGIPTDVVDATEHLLRMADDFSPRQVDLGTVNGRAFTFSSGVGLDASVTERVDRHPRLKARFGPWYYTLAAVSTFNRKYLVKPPRLRVEADGATIDGVTAVVQSSDPYTYFASRPIRLCEDAGPDNGDLSLAVLTKTTPLELLTISPRAFWGRPEVMSRHRHIKPVPSIDSARITSLDGRPLPIQVDGDHIGEETEIEYRAVPRGLTVVS